jgi:hypothetical protein
MTDTTPHTVTLAVPLRFSNGNSITALTLVRPSVRALRGISLAALVQMDVDALIKLLPRIAQPLVTEQMLGDLDPADLVSLANEVMGFLLEAAPSPPASSP